METEPIGSLQYDITRWTTVDGLPSNTIQSLLQTRDGFLWIGTRAGLARFDGVKMRVFNRGNTPEMEPSDNCICMAEDIWGTLWIGTKNGLLAYRNGSFLRYENDAFPAASLANSIWSIAPAQGAGLWVSTEFGSFRWENGRWQPLTNFPAGYLRTEPTGTVRNLISATQIFEEENGSVWIGGASGLFHRPSGAVEFQQVPETRPEPSLNWWTAQRLSRRASGGVWFLNVHGLYLHDGNELQEWKIGREQARYVLGPDGGDGLWVRSLSDGIGRFNGAQFNWLKASTNLPLPDIEIAVSDREQNLWVGSGNNGLFRLKPRTVINYTTEDGLSSDNVWSISEAQDGTIWAGAKPGLNLFREGKWRSVVILALPAHSPDWNNFNTVLADAGSTIWVNHGNLQRYDGEKFTLVTLPGDDEKKEPPIHSPATIYKARNGDLWVGGMYGLVQITESGWEWRASASTRTYNSVTGTSLVSTNRHECLSYDSVIGILEDSDGAIWAGGTEGKVVRIKGGRIEVFGGERNIPRGAVGPVLAEKGGVVWFGSTSGLLRWKDGNFAHLNRKHGLPEGTVLNVLEDDFGNFWLNGHHGIHRARKADLIKAADGETDKVYFTSFDETDGMRRAEGNGGTFPNSCKTRDGRLWFPTMGGIVVIDPRSILPNTNVVPVIEYVIADEEVIWGEGAAEKFKRENASEIQLGPGRAHVLQVRYTVPTFKRPEKVRFQYRLRGQEEKWVTPDPEGDRIAYYTNLRPGRYSFELKADNTEGAWGKPVTFNFAVAPHFWQTWPFYAACAVMVVGAGLSIHYIRLKVQRRILVLEQKHALAEERARIARDMHDQLGASLTKIQLLSVLASRDKERTAAVNKQLESIAQTSREAAEDMDEIVWAVNPRNDHLENLADYLGRYSEEFLRAAGLRCKLNIPATLPAVVVNTEVRHAVFLAVKECLNNVAKHARAREVLFEMSTREGALEIIIADDGIGFDPSQNNGKGDGLENLQNRLKRFSGWIRWESSANAGTAVRIGLPIDRKLGI